MFPVDVTESPNPWAFVSTSLTTHFDLWSVAASTESFAASPNTTTGFPRSTAIPVGPGSGHPPQGPVVATTWSVHFDPSSVAAWTSNPPDPSTENATQGFPAASRAIPGAEMGPASDTGVP